MRNTFLRDCDNRLITREIYKNWEYQNQQKNKRKLFQESNKRGNNNK